MLRATLFGCRVLCVEYCEAKRGRRGKPAYHFYLESVLFIFFECSRPMDEHKTDRPEFECNHSIFKQCNPKPFYFWSSCWWKGNIDWIYSTNTLLVVLYKSWYCGGRLLAMGQFLCASSRFRKCITSSRMTFACSCNCSLSFAKNSTRSCRFVNHCFFLCLHLRAAMNSMLAAVFYNNTHTHFVSYLVDFAPENACAFHRLHRLLLRLAFFF